MSGKDELVILFQQLHKVISKIGLQKLLARINAICANHYLLEKNDFLLSKKRGNISEARRMCFALIKNNLNISDSSIGEYVGGRSKQFVNNELKSVVLDKEKIKTKYEHEFYENYVKLNNEVLMYKNSY
jgi:chromosomal replication initiation ATPase DnaA